MGLFDIFKGGKQLELTDDYFGEMITEKLTSKELNDSFDWHSEYVMEGFDQPTLFMLEGNKKGIDKGLKAAAIDLVENWTNKYKPELNRILAANDDFRMFRDWEKEFYLSIVWTNEEGVIEVTFDPIDEADESWFGFDLVNGEIREIDGE